MSVLEAFLNQEGFEFPSEQKLAWIVYNSSFGFREHTSCTAEVIQNSRNATALVVINRVRQRVRPAPGWERHAPSAEHGPARGTEPAAPMSAGGRDPDLAGNADAFQGCLRAARLARDRKWQALDSAELLAGAQFYGHIWVCCMPVTSAHIVNGKPVILRFGPLWSPGGANMVPPERVEVRGTERFCKRCHQSAANFRQYLLVGRDEVLLRRAREWESVHAAAVPAL